MSVDDALIKTCDSIAAVLTGGNYLPSRQYHIETGLAELKTWRIIVVPATDTRATVDRSHSQEKIEIHIGVQRPVDIDNVTEQDDVVAAAREIAGLLNLHDHEINTDQVSMAVFESLEHQPLFYPEHLQRYGVMTSVVRIKYELIPI